MDKILFSHMLTNVLVIIGVVLLMYYRTFKYLYIIDDIDVVKPKTEETKNKFKRAWEHLRGYKYTDNRLAHVITTLLHMVNCILVYFVFGANQVSFLTALLFAINPVTNQVAIWLSGKPYGMSTMLLLLGLLFIPLMPFIYGFCVWWAPNSIFFPLMFVMHKPHWYLILLPLVGYLFSRKFRKTYTNRIGTGTDEMVTLKPRKLIIFFKTLGYYFRHCLVPYKVGMCHTYLHSFGLSAEETKHWYRIDRYFFLGIAVCLAAIVALFHRTNPIAYGYLWFVFLTAQWCNIIMVNHPITERYVYLPTIGLMYFLANIIVGTPLVWVFLTFYAIRLFYFLPAYKDIIQYWKSNTENFPDVAMGYNQYGLGLVNYGNTGTAIDTWIKGIQIRKNDFRLSYNLANLMMAVGQTQHAIRFVKTAEENLDHKQNREFWMKNINEIKAEARKRGFEVN